MERTALISNPAMAKEEYRACYDMLKMAHLSSLKEVREKEPYLFEYYRECFGNLVFVNMISDKIKYQSVKVDDEGNTEIITSCSNDIISDLRKKGNFVYDFENGIDDVFSTVYHTLFEKDIKKDSFFHTNDSDHAINKLSISVYHLLVDLINDCDNRESHEVSIYDTVCTSDEGEKMTYEETIPDERINIENDYINNETTKKIKGFARDNCLFFIQKKHPERMLGYILSLVKAYSGNDHEYNEVLVKDYFKDDYKEDMVLNNGFIASMIKEHGYAFTVERLCNMATFELNIDIQDISNHNFNFKKPASEVTKRDIELWKNRSIEDAKKRSENIKY